MCALRTLEGGQYPIQLYCILMMMIMMTTTTTAMLLLLMMIMTTKASPFASAPPWDEINEMVSHQFPSSLSNVFRVTLEWVEVYLRQRLSSYKTQNVPPHHRVPLKKNIKLNRCIKI